jgi:hypothetical protein
MWRPHFSSASAQNSPDCRRLLGAPQADVGLNPGETTIEMAYAINSDPA